MKALTETQKTSRRRFMILHWVLSLGLAPLFASLIDLIMGVDPHLVVSLLEVYPIALIFSVAFSAPTFLIYIVVYQNLRKTGVSWARTKLVLIGIMVVGAWSTIGLIDGGMAGYITLSYVTSVLVCGGILSLLFRS